MASVSASSSQRERESLQTDIARIKLALQAGAIDDSSEEEFVDSDDDADALYVDTDSYLDGESSRQSTVVQGKCGPSIIILTLSSLFKSMFL